MAEEATTTTEETTTETTETTKEDQRVPYERFQQANAKAKEAAEKATKLEKDLADLRSQLEEREHAGLPELEQAKKKLEQAEKRAEEAEKAKQDADVRLVRTEKERWVAAAAQEQKFADPSDAAAFLNLDEIEDEKDAERAVKRLAGQKKHLLQGDEKVLPGKVLADGRKAAPPAQASAIDSNAEAESLRAELAKFRDGWKTLD